MLHKDFKVNSGITKKQISQLIEFTNSDELIKKNTSDRQRFGNEDLFKKWFAKKKFVYTLTDKNGDLHGIIWFGQKNLPDNQTYEIITDENKYGLTFAIRLYEKARGRHLSKPFMIETIRIFKNSDDYQRISANKIWLETRSDNLVARKLYEELGWIKAIENLDGKTIFLIEV